MVKNELFVSALGVLASISVLHGFVPPASPVEGSPTALTEPCAPALDPLTEPKPGAPAAPKNLRIIGGGDDEQLEFETARPSGPYALPYSASRTLEAGTHSYFDLLSARPDCKVAYSLRSQAQLDWLPTKSKAIRTMPVVLDTLMDAALFQVDVSGESPNSGSTDTQQKVLPAHVNGTSMLLTWDFRYDKSFKWIEEGNLRQHKTWVLYMDGEPGALFVIKTHYAQGTNSGKGLAEVEFTSNSKVYLGPGTTRESERYHPRVNDFFIQPDTWTRMWVFIEGKIGGGLTEGSEPVYASIWAADENRDPILLHDRMALLTTTGGFDQFILTYDASQDIATGGLMKSWNRNAVILTGIELPEVKKLLARP